MSGPRRSPSPAEADPPAGRHRPGRPPVGGPHRGHRPLAQPGRRSPRSSGRLPPPERRRHAAGPDLRPRAEALRWHVWPLQRPNRTGPTGPQIGPSSTACAPREPSPRPVHRESARLPLPYRAARRSRAATPRWSVPQDQSGRPRRESGRWILNGCAVQAGATTSSMVARANSALSFLGQGQPLLFDSRNLGLHTR